MSQLGFGKACLDLGHCTVCFETFISCLFIICYIKGSAHGEIYGLDHDMTRMSPWNMALTRPETVNWLCLQNQLFVYNRLVSFQDVPGLYLTGQDAMLCGFTGALFGGVLCASSVLRRNVIDDLEKLHAQLYKNHKK